MPSEKIASGGEAEEPLRSSESLCRHAASVPGVDWALEEVHPADHYHLAGQLEETADTSPCVPRTCSDIGMARILVLGA